MDSITQAALGAAIGESMLGKKIGNRGAVLGALVATIPDLDVALYLCYSKFDMLSIHRGYSHSVVFSILGALLISWGLSKIKWLQGVSAKSLLLFTWLCLFTHMLLDTFTAYGTQLFLPFSNHRAGLDSINVVDPAYTLPLLIGLALSLFFFKVKPNRSKFTNIALIVSSAYLLFTLINKEIVESKISKRMEAENIEFDELLSVPVGMANLQWYGVAKRADSLYMTQCTAFSARENKIVAFPINEEYLQLVDPDAAQTMRWFAKDFYTVEKLEGKIRFYNLQVDMRGIVDDGKQKAPTHGYFELSTDAGETRFSSGSIEVE